MEGFPAISPLPPDHEKPPAGTESDGGQPGEGRTWGRRPPGLSGSGQSTMGAMIRAKLFRARFSRLFTVPRFVSVISAISS